MNINNRELSEPEIRAYINEMKKLLREIQNKLESMLVEAEREFEKT